MPLNEFKDYDEYWGKRGFHAPSFHRAEIISKYIEQNSKILDIGCGDGTVIDYLSKNNSPIKIIGIDISKKAVEYTKKRGYEAYKMDIASEDFKNFVKKNAFDYIIITEVLEHIQEPEKIMLSIKGSFNKSIFASIPNSGFILCRLRLLFGKFPITVIVYHIKEHIRFWTHQDFLYWCDYLGFKVINYIVGAPLSDGFINSLTKKWPSLFAMQIIYEIRKK